MEALRRERFWQFRIFAYMFGIFGAAALFLAGVGVYGVVSFSVSQRTQEIGVRIALGASRAAVLGLAVRQGAKPLLIGWLVDPLQQCVAGEKKLRCPGAGRGVGGRFGTGSWCCLVRG